MLLEQRVFFQKEKRIAAIFAALFCSGGALFTILPSPSRVQPFYTAIFQGTWYAWLLTGLLLLYAVFFVLLALPEKTKPRTAWILMGILLISIAAHLLLCFRSLSYLTDQLGRSRIDQDAGVFRLVLDGVMRLLISAVWVVYSVSACLNGWKKTRFTRIFQLLFVPSLLCAIHALSYYIGNIFYFPPLSDLFLLLQLIMIAILCRLEVCDFRRQQELLCER